MLVATVPVGGMAKAKAFFELLKFRLSFFVVFSGVVGFILANTDFQFNSTLLWFALGSFLVTGSANTINQLLEEEYDKLMKRTMSRPLPSGRLTALEAGIFAMVTFLVGSFILMFQVNLLACLLSAISLFLYAFVYTPLKRVGPIAVYVGAIPGALPPLIGWAAATEDIGVHAITLFVIQFIWQFPHFWAIAWILDEDYKRAGFKLLPAGGGKNLNTAFQIMINVLILIPLSLLPAKLGLTGFNSAILVTMAGVFFLIQTFYLMKECSNKAAKHIMFGSFLYLTVIQIVYMVDRI
jgi:protoheme IX farnesyltransferase